MHTLVSVIIAAYNEEANIARLLNSVTGQNYQDIEILVIDDSSTDRTAEIAKKYTSHVFIRPHAERSAQRNFGASQAKGEYLFFLDADMKLTPQVISSCIDLARSYKFDALIIPEKSFGENYWARCKALERNCYIGDPQIEAPRFIRSRAFTQIKGYDFEMISGEDWDLHRRLLAKKFRIGRTPELILHNEGSLSYFKVLQKKFYYAQKSDQYISKNISGLKDVIRFIVRPSIFKNWRLLLSDPFHIPGLILLVWGEILVGGLGAIIFKPVFLKRILLN